MNKWKSYLLGCILSLLPWVCSADRAVVAGVQVLPGMTATRLIFKMSAPDKTHVFLLANPNRLVVDFDNALLRIEPKRLPLSSTILANARLGWPKPGTSRVVFDLNSRAHIKQFLSGNGRDSLLIIDVEANNANAITPKPFAKALASVSTITARTETKTYSTSKTQIVEVVKQRPLVIVVDAGHGGKDPGTIGIHGTREKDVVLGIALRLAELINADPKLHASLTRHGDYFVTLKGRLQLARQDKADLFIAIHADSYFNNHSIGASVYALSEHGASSMQARWLADRENHSELGGVDLNGLGDHSYLLRSVLIDLAQTATVIDSVRFGTDILSSLESVTSLHYAHVEQAPFMVLKSPDIPSILVETGFLSNPVEEERLRDTAYRDKLARALLAGIRQYVATHPMMASNSKSQNQDLINSQV